MVGGGPAGATCAQRLASAGLAVDLFEARPAGEKPCGGGIPGPALREFPELLDPALPRRVVRRILVESPAGHAVTLKAREGIHVFSRREMDAFLRGRARQAGASIHETTVRAVARDREGRWDLVTDEGRHGGYDFLVGADGVRGIVRRSLLGRPPETTLTLARYAYVAGLPEDGAVRAASTGSGGSFQEGGGAHAPGARPSRLLSPEMVLRFMPGSDGYLWVFPRRDHLSVGICATSLSTSAASLERELLTYMRDRHPGLESRATAVKGYFIPSDPAPPATSGRGWALVGDAGGFVDPVTREGIAPAMRSAEALARGLICWDSRSGAMPGTPELPANLRRAHDFREGFYREGFTDRMVRMAADSRAIRRVLGDLIGGCQGYLGLKRRLILNALPCGVQMTMAALARRHGGGTGGADRAVPRSDRPAA